MAERTFVALDLETTGLDSRTDAIIEIGAVRFCGEVILARFSTFVNPQRAIPLRVQQITGIVDGDVQGAPTLAMVLPELLAFVDASVDAVVAHNTGFDLGFLQAAGVNFHRPALDTHELATLLLPGLPSYSLGEICRVLDISLISAHRALADAEATAALFMQLCRRVETIPPSILQTLVDCGRESRWPPMLLWQDALDPSRIGSAPDLNSAQGATALPLPPHDGLPLQSVPVDLVERAFGPQGALAAMMGESYEARPSQTEMARLVIQALNSGFHQMVEAGTGTGKSLAYLLPAALWAAGNGQRVVIATDTLTLQDQLLDAEIPPGSTDYGGSTT